MTREEVGLEQRPPGSPVPDRRDEPLLQVRGLSVRFETPSGIVPAVTDVSLELRPGETLGLIGESGCGKSTVMLALAGLLPPAGRIAEGEARWKDRDLLALSDSELRQLRGKELGLVFQDPHAALHPALPVLDQVAEAWLAHDPELAREASRELALEALDAAGIPPAIARARRYAPEWSGGMRQRALIAMALANDPELLIADEPTTALDVTVQAEILELLRGATGSEFPGGEAGRRSAEERDSGRALLLITHDLGVIAELADRVAVMYAGRLVETGSVERIFDDARHPYTIGLLASRPGVRSARGARLEGRPPDPRVLPSGCAFHPRCPRAGGREPCRTVLPRPAPASDREGGEASAACHFADEPAAGDPGRAEVEARESERRPKRTDEVLFEATGLTTVYAGRGGGPDVRAVADVRLAVRRGEILGLVGESGCGKSTLARTLVGLQRLSAGTVRIDGRDFLDLAPGLALERSDRRRVQMVFQDPYASLNPRRTLGQTLATALRIHGLFDARGGWSEVGRLLDEVGLSASRADAFPHELSGGQRQRASIARALAVEPEIVVLDEPLTALDVAVQAQILSLLARLRRERGLAMILIAHDLTVVGEVADRVAVMYLGRIVETGPVGAVFAAASHPYTRALLSAVPAAHPKERRLSDRSRVRGEVPDPARPPPGCAFHPRCPVATAVCRERRPELERRTSGAASACFHPESGPVSGPATPPDRAR